MFEFLINLLLAGFFMSAQAEEQMTVDGLVTQEYRLPQSEIRNLQKEGPWRNVNSESVGVEITARSALVVDEASGKVLYEKNSSEVRSIASLTKLMTALVFLDHNPGWTKVVEISGEDYREGAVTYLIAGETVNTFDLFHAALIASNNEAAVALARSTGMSAEQFVSAMNQKAQYLGLSNAQFVDVTGLSPDNKLTAVEVTMLLRESLQNDQLAKAISTRAFSVDIINKGISRRLVNTGWLLGKNFGIGDDNYRVESGKTGHLDESGYCFASQIINQDEKQILTVVLGSETVYDRFTDTESLAYWVYNNYIWP